MMTGKKKILPKIPNDASKITLGTTVEFRRVDFILYYPLVLESCSFFTCTFSSLNQEFLVLILENVDSV